MQHGSPFTGLRTVISGWLVIIAALIVAFLGQATLSGCSSCRRPLDEWCLHESEDLNAPEECRELRFLDSDGEPPTNGYRCGDYDLMLDGPDLSGRDYYFDADSHELVAVRVWTDTNKYCGGFEFWYGKKIRCDLTCTYGDNSDLPEC